jgi:probable HAF family extracellular repeat protein
MPGHASFVTGTSAINDLGQVVGGFDADGVTHAFLYAGGQASDIGTLGGDYAAALAISGTGPVTGISARADSERHAFLYASGAMTDVGTLGGNVSIGYAVNDAGQVAGQSVTAAGVAHAFVSTTDGLVDLGALIEALPQSGTVDESSAFGINGHGIVIGSYMLSDPADTQMPVKRRAFIATPAGSLFDALLAMVTGVGPGKSLLGKVQQASRLYTAGDLRATCRVLGAFVHEVNKRDGKKIEHATALQLLEEAGTIQNVLGCR